MKSRIWRAGMLLLIAGSCPAARLTWPAQRAFREYVSNLEARLVEQHARPATYAAVLDVGPDERADAVRELTAGSLRVDPVNGGMRQVSDALLHHWRGAAFVRGAKPEQMLVLLRDYNGLSGYYAPEVESSRALADHGDVALIAMRLKKQTAVTVVLDAEYDVKTGLSSSKRGYGWSRSRHIWQIENPGTAKERRLPEGNDDGFLWRLNSYWSFIELPGGLLIECEAVSLTRDIPTGLGWLVTPMIKDLPRESLGFTLRATEKALTAHSQREAH